MQRRPGLRRSSGSGTTQELADPPPVEILALVVEGHRHVEGIPHGDDVGAPRIERDPVERGVGLDEPPVALGRELGVHLSRGVPSQSSQGDSRASGSGQLGRWKMSRAQIIWTQVVPLFERVLMTMSPSRKGKPIQRPLSSSGER